VVEAYEWYEVHRRGLGEEFLRCVDATLSGISRNPDLYAIAFSNYRRVLVRRFPYAVFYEVVDDSVTVYGVLHTARDSAKRSSIKVSVPKVLRKAMPPRSLPTFLATSVLDPGLMDSAIGDWQNA
jgi:hypothetical protein